MKMSNGVSRNGTAAGHRRLSAVRLSSTGGTAGKNGTAGPTGKRAATYVRMSTDDQENSPERQREQIRPECERYGYLVTKTYDDLGMKGYDDTRPGFQRLLRDAQAGLFDVVVVDEVSRLSRDTPLDFFGKVAYPLQQAGVRLHVVGKGLVDWNDLGGMIRHTVDQHASQDESVKLSRRVVTELARKALRGELAQGKPAYGYRRVRVDDLPRLILGDEREIEVVRFIFDAYVNHDMSLGMIQRELHRRGVAASRGGTFWGRSIIRKMLGNRVYVGDFVYNRASASRFHRMSFASGEPRVQARNGVQGKRQFSTNDPADWIVVTDAHPAIIDRDTFQRAQAMLKQNRERRTPTGRRNDYVLAKLLTCSHCGSVMTGELTQEGHRIYKCSGYMRYGSAFCKLYRVRETVILDEVLRLLQEQFLSAERLAKLRAEAKRIRDEGGIEKLVKAHRREIAELEKKVARGTANVLQLDAELVPQAQAQLREWQEQRRTLAADVDRLEAENPVENVEQLIEHIESNLWKLRTAIIDDDRGLLREVLRGFVVRLELRFSSRRGRVRTYYTLAGGVAHLHSGDRLAIEAISSYLSPTAA